MPANRMNWIGLVAVLVALARVRASPTLTVSDGGVYSGLIVKIGDEVPRQLCDKVIRGVQVGHIIAIRDCMYSIVYPKPRYQP